MAEEIPDVPHDVRIEIRFTCTTDSFTVLQNIRYNMINEIVLQRNAIVRNDSQDIVFNMKLPPQTMEAF